MRNFTILFLIIFFAGNAHAQQIEGRILSAYSGEPVAGAVVVVEDTDLKVTSGPDGKFLLKLPQLPVRLGVSAANFKKEYYTVYAREDEHLVYLIPVAESLSEVILRSTIIPQELLNTPASVSVLSEADLEKYDETNIVTALNSVSGVYVHQGALNTNKISIRGIGARSQYSTNRVKAYFMEIPISTAEGETTLDDIDQTVVERAEIIKGPVSSVYGAGLGGVINLYAAEPDVDGFMAKTSSIYGSFNLLKNMLQTSWSSENADLVATYNSLTSDGYRENGSYRRDSFNFNGKVEAGEKNLVGVFAQFTDLKAYIPSSLNIDDFVNNPSSAAFTWAASQGYESYRKGMFGLSNRHTFSEDFSNVSSVYLNFRDGYEPRPFDILNENHHATGARTKFLFQSEFFALPSEVSFGAETYWAWYNVSTFENLYEDFSEEGSIPGRTLSYNTQDRSYYNIFAQWNLALTQKLNLETGLNYNATKYELNDQFHDDLLDQSGEYRFQDIFSPRLGLVYSLTPEKNLYLSVSHGFSTPTVAETLTPEGLINTELEPETGINYEIGFKGNFFNNRLYTEVAAYSIQVENLLVAERVGEDQYIGRNAGKTDHNGLEFLVNYNFLISDWITAGAYVNASFNAFEFDEFVDNEIDLSGNALPAVPDNSINAGLEISTEFGVQFFANYQHEGQMPLNDENSAFTEAYDLVHVKASYTLDLLEDWEIKIFGGINNVLDEHYAASIVPNAVGFGGASPRYYYPGNPVNYYGGVSLRYMF